MLNHLDLDHGESKVFLHAPKRLECLWGPPSLQFFPGRKAASEWILPRNFISEDKNE